jgi:hypothetical protein
MVRIAAASLSAALLVASPGQAGPADVVSASARCQASTCTFSVTVRHADEGWDHYADSWQVLAPDGSVIATRVLQHPHVEEQPFTRELRSVEIPVSVESVRIRAHDSTHGFGGREVIVSLQRD